MIFSLRQIFLIYSSAKIHLIDFGISFVDLICPRSSQKYVLLDSRLISKDYAKKTVAEQFFFLLSIIYVGKCFNVKDNPDLSPNIHRWQKMNTKDGRMVAFLDAILNPAIGCLPSIAFSFVNNHHHSLRTHYLSAPTTPLPTNRVCFIVSLIVVAIVGRDYLKVRREKKEALLIARYLATQPATRRHLQFPASAKLL